MMKKILIVIHDLRIGGAQKSLLSFLQALEDHPRRAEYEVQLLPLNPTGEFMAQLPDSVILRQPDNTLRWMGQRMNLGLLKHFSLRGVLGEIVWLLRKLLKRFPAGLNGPQKLWNTWRGLIPLCREEYDVAIAYMDGGSSYYVMDKVRAGRKVLWLHSDYRLQGYAPAFDAKYYHDCDQIVTVSPECRKTLAQAHPAQSEKIKVLGNISSYPAVLAQSRQPGAAEFDDCQGLRLLCVGRLHPQKGMDIAVEAARYLQAAQCDFRWLIVGEGSERSRLEKMIAEYGLQERVFLLGSRTNPYVYMAKCDILVQPSRVEGKSIVLDEAKMLCKPLIATRYQTVGDAIRHGENGWITDMNGEALAEGILHLQANPVLCQRMIQDHQQSPNGNENLLEEYIRVML